MILSENDFEHALLAHFGSRLATRANALRVSAPDEGDVPLGVVVDLATVERLQSLLDDASKKGARISAAEPATAC